MDTECKITPEQWSNMVKRLEIVESSVRALVNRQKNCRAEHTNQLTELVGKVGSCELCEFYAPLPPFPDNIKI